jgi:ElaA protein
MDTQRYLRLVRETLDTVSRMAADVTTRTFSELTTTQLHDLLRLRGDVFVVEQTCVYADIDGRDTEPTTRHHWIDRDGSIAAYARTLAESDGATRIGRVATAPRLRAEGLAARLVAHLVATDDGPFVLDAQSHLVGWYERLGFGVAGAEFVEDAIAHVPMALARRT